MFCLWDVECHKQGGGSDKIFRDYRLVVHLQTREIFPSNEEKVDFSEEIIYYLLIIFTFIHNHVYSLEG